MKINIVIFALLQMISSVTYCQKFDSCVLDFEKGKINTIQINKASFEEIESVFGIGVLSKKRYKKFTLEMNFFPKTSYILEYPDLGLKFETKATNKAKSKRKVNRFVITSSGCRSSKGIGVGSTYFDIKEKYSEYVKSLGYEVSNQIKKTRLIYSNEIGSYAQFNAFGNFTTQDFKVEEIIIQ